MRAATYCAGLATMATLAFLLCTTIPACHSAAVMSIDLGSEWLKVGVVAPGLPMEIALNKESKRKTPAVIAFRDGNRIFGEDAQTIGLRFPDRSYAYLTDLLGKRADNPLVEEYRSRFPYHTLEADPVRGTVVFRSADGETFTVEELVAQFIQKAREAAEATAGQPVTECVLVVPGFFGQAERRALLAAAQLANIKVLQLINDYTAVALNYGIFARKEFNETAAYYMFYDMGASKTSAVVVSYQLQKDKQTREQLPVIQVLGVGLGPDAGAGWRCKLRLRDWLAGEFNKMGKTKTDVRTNGRAMAKLFKEAGRVKNVLSANTHHQAQIEGLLEEHDFKLPVTREKFEELCADLFARVAKPVEQALEAAQLSLDNLKQVILFGGGTRVPKVQEHLKAAIKQELGKNINMDEAAAMGAVYRAADLAIGFRVAKFVTKDAAVLPVQVVFDREGDSGAIKQVRRSLFGRMNAYPQKKVITFNKHTVDFAFDVQYAELEHLSAAEQAAIGGFHIAKVQLKQVAEVLAKQGVKSGEAAIADDPTEPKVESKGIKAHFELDESGVFAMKGIELVLEKTVAGAAAEESPLSKLGSTISKLFSSDTDTEGEVQTDDSPAAPQNGTETEAEEAELKPTEAVNGTESGETGPKNLTEPALKIVTSKHAIPNSVELLTAPALSGDQLTAVSAKIDEISAREAKTVRKETALNALESYVIDTLQRLDETEFSECATEAEAGKIREACSGISDWLYEDGEHADAETYEKKLGELKELCKPMLARHWEHQERPETVEQLRGMLKTAREFHVNGKNFTKEANPGRDVFTPVELETLEKNIAEAEKWLDEQVAEQKKLGKAAEVKLTVRALNERMATLDREIKYLVNKLKIWKPKVEPKPKAEKKADGKKGEKKADGKKAGKKAEKKAEEEEKAEEEVKPVVEEVVEEEKVVEAEVPTIEASETVKTGEEEQHSEL